MGASSAKRSPFLHAVRRRRNSSSRRAWTAARTGSNGLISYSDLSQMNATWGLGSDFMS
jgi:hypothetical protein